MSLHNYNKNKWQLLGGVNVKHAWGVYMGENWFYTAIKQHLTLKRISGLDRKLAVFPLLGKSWNGMLFLILIIEDNI